MKERKVIDYPASDTVPKPAIKTPYNYTLFPLDMETTDKPSQTIPDQSMSMTEILRRYASGLPLGGQREPMFEGDNPELPPDWEKWDLSEKEAYRKENADRIAAIYEDLQHQADKTGKYKPKDKKPLEQSELDLPAPPSGADQPPPKPDKP